MNLARGMISIAAVFIFAVAASFAVEAATWEPFGLGGGGHMCRVAFDPSNEQTILVGSDVTGVLRSLDGGQSWRAHTRYLPDYYVQHLVVDPGDGQRVLAATAEGLALSVDGGDLWQTVLQLPLSGNKYSAAVSTVAFDQSDDQVVWAGVGRFRFSGTASAGGDGAGSYAHVWQSAERGAEGSWIALSGPFDTFGVHSILPFPEDLDPTHPGAERVLVSSTGGIWLGEYAAGSWSWTPRQGLLPHGDGRDMEALVDSSGAIERIYLVLDSDWDGVDITSIYDHAAGYGGGVWYSDNLGVSWLPSSFEDGSDGLHLEEGVTDSASAWIEPKNMRHLAIDQQTGDVYLALTRRSTKNEGVWRGREDAGAWQWTRLTESRVACTDPVRCVSAGCCGEMNLRHDYFTSLGGVDGLAVGPVSGDVIFTTNVQVYRCAAGACEPGVAGAPVWEPLHTVISETAGMLDRYHTAGMDVTKSWSATVVPSLPGVWLSGIGDFGLLRSDDGAVTWRPIGDKSEAPYAKVNIGTAEDPEYIGYGVRNCRGIFFSPGDPAAEVFGIFGSWKDPTFELWRQAGVPGDDVWDWEYLPIPGASYVEDVLMLDADTMLVGTRSGVFRGTRDRGSWEFALDEDGLPFGVSTRAYRLIQETGAGVAGRILMARPYMSADGGIFWRDGLADSWHQASYSGSPQRGMVNVMSLTWSTVNPDRVWSGSASSRAGNAGVLVSNDRGENWQMLAEDFADNGDNCFDVLGLAARLVPGSDPARERLYAGLAPRFDNRMVPCRESTYGGVHFSDDDGVNWSMISDGLGAGHATYLRGDESNPSRLILGTDGNGSSWLVDDFGAATGPGEASSSGEMAAQAGAGSTVDFTFQPAPCAADHVVYQTAVNAPLSESPSWTAEHCFLGASGSGTFDPGTPPAGTVILFVVVGNNGLVEGSYGRDSHGNERKQASELVPCSYSRQLSNACSGP